MRSRPSPRAAQHSTTTPRPRMCVCIANLGGEGGVSRSSAAYRLPTQRVSLFVAPITHHRHGPPRRPARDPQLAHPFSAVTGGPRIPLLLCDGGFLFRLPH